MLKRIHDRSIGTQFLLLFVAVGLVLALSAWYCMYLVVGIALEDVPTEERATVTAVVRWMVAIVVLVTTCSLGGAVAIVRRSILHSLERVDRATDAIARGEFSHRIGGGRRDELGRLGDSIDRAAARLEQLDRSRQELVARVSHELRTPLTVIRCQAYSLSRTIERSDELAKVAVIDDEIEGLIGQIDDLLAASSLRAQPVQLARRAVPIGELAGGLERRFAERGQAQGSAVRVRTECPLELVEVDRARIDQVLANLVGNALRHATRGSVVEVSMTRCAGGVRIAVANEGDTIPATALDGLFEPFAQGAGGPTGRAGLGLAIVRDLLAAHGATIGAVSHAGRTEFAFELPVAQQAAAAPVAAATTPPPARRRFRRPATSAVAMGADA